MRSRCRGPRHDQSGYRDSDRLRTFAHDSGMARQASHMVDPAATDEDTAFARPRVSERDILADVDGAVFLAMLGLHL